MQGNEVRNDEQPTDVNNRDDNDAPGRVISLLFHRIPNIWINARRVPPGTACECPPVIADRSSKGMSWHLYRFHTAEACSCGFRSLTIIFILHPQAGDHTHIRA